MRSSGDRPLVVARELTKVHEELIRGTIASAITHFGAHEPRGEFTLIFAPATAEEPEAVTLTDDEAWTEFGHLTQIGLSRREAVAALARRTQRPAREVYACVERGKERAARANSE